jgi:hypothetical protein
VYFMSDFSEEGADCDTHHYLVMGKVRKRMTVGK